MRPLQRDMRTIIRSGSLIDRFRFIVMAVTAILAVGCKQSTIQERILTLPPPFTAYKVDPYIQVAAELQSLGREAACSVMSQAGTNATCFQELPIFVLNGCTKRLMFQDIPEAMLARMRELEEIDLRDRSDGTSRLNRLRQISSEVGRFIALLAAAAPDGRRVEIGTSAGYSTLWLALACRATGRKITTFEILDEKAKLGRLTFRAAGVSDVVELVHGDALTCLPEGHDIGFCFLDAEKEIYGCCYEAIVPQLVPGGILVADNAISHEATLRPMLDRALQDVRVDALIVPIAKGELVCRRK